MSEVVGTELSEEEALDLASVLEIPTAEKTSTTTPAAEEPAFKPNFTPAEPGAPVVTSPLELPNADDAADNLITMIEMAEGTILTAVLAAKNYFALSGEEKKLVADAIKKPKSERTEAEQRLIDFKNETTAKNQAKLDAIEWTDGEIKKLRKPARLLVKQNNMKVSPEWALILGVINVVGDHCIDIFMD